MRLLLPLLIALPLLAQEPAAPPPGGHEGHEHQAPKNLKLLQPSEVMPAMRSFRIALGQKCSFCHVEGNFASDDNPHKEVARKMIVMAREINTKFPDGEMHVTCYTCHRGATEPATEAPAAAK